MIPLSPDELEKIRVQAWDATEDELRAMIGSLLYTVAVETEWRQNVQHLLRRHEEDLPILANKLAKSEETVAALQARVQALERALQAMYDMAPDLYKDLSMAKTLPIAALLSDVSTLLKGKKTL